MASIASVPFPASSRGGRRRVGDPQKRAGKRDGDQDTRRGSPSIVPRGHALKVDMAETVGLPEREEAVFEEVYRLSLAVLGGVS